MLVAVASVSVFRLATHTMVVHEKPSLTLMLHYKYTLAILTFVIG